MLYNSINKKPQFEVDVTPSFSYTVLPKLFATFSDSLHKRYWSMKFQKQDDLSNFSRTIAMVKDFLLSTYTDGQSRRLIVQDLTLGDPGSKEVQVGDQVKVKSRLRTAHTDYPRKGGLGEKISTDAKRFVVGDGTSFMPDLESGVVGMKKKATRFMVIPPERSTNAPKLWGSHVPSGVTLLLDITVTSIKPKHLVDQKKAKRRSAGVRDMSHSPPMSSNTSSNHPISNKPKEINDQKKSKSHENHPTSIPSPTLSVDSLQRQTPLSRSPSPPPPMPSIEPQIIATSLPPPHPDTYHSSAPRHLSPDTSPRQDIKRMPSQGQEYNSVMDEQERLKERMRYLAQAAGGRYNPHSTMQSVGQYSPKETSVRSVKPEDSLSLCMKQLGLEEYIGSFRQHQIKYEDLILLEPKEVAQLIPQLGPRKRLISKINELRNSSVPPQSKPIPTNIVKPNFNTQDNIFASEQLFPKAKQDRAIPNRVSQEAINNAYERGKAEVLGQAKERIDQLKSTATSKFHELQELVQVKEEKIIKVESQMLRAKEVIKRLRDENSKMKEEKERALNQLNHAKDWIKKLREEVQQEKIEKESVLKKSRQYVQQVRENKGEINKHIKVVMEQLFKHFSSQLDKNQLYDGQAMKELAKSSIKTVTTNYIKHTDTNT